MNKKWDNHRIGKWVTYICEDGDKEHRGYFEHDEYGEGGGIWFLGLFALMYCIYLIAKLIKGGL